MTKKITQLGKWLELRRAVSKKSGPAIISLFTDFVVPHGGQISLGSLVDAATLVGLSEPTIRSSVNRLIGEGWLVSHAVGRRSIYQLSPAGLRRCTIASRRIYKSDETVWNGQWHFLIAQKWSIPPERYEEFVNDACWAGFGRVSDNVFIRPIYGDDTAKTDEYLHEWDSSVIGFTGKKDEPYFREPIKELISHTWDLDLVNSRYKTFIVQHQPLIDLIAEPIDIPGSMAFAIRSMMMHDFRRIRILDPNLPVEYLPTKWNGTQALEVAGKIYNKMQPASEEFVMRTMQGCKETLPGPHPWFYLRFGGLQGCSNQ